MRRATSHPFTWKLPRAADSYSELLVTLEQNGEIIINKTKNDMELDGNRATLILTQEETLLFEAGIPAYIQLRAYNGPTDAPGSKVWKIPVYRSLNEEVLT